MEESIPKFYRITDSISCYETHPPHIVAGYCFAM